MAPEKFMQWNQANFVVFKADDAELDNKVLFRGVSLELTLHMHLPFGIVFDSELKESSHGSPKLLQVSIDSSG